MGDGLQSEETNCSQQRECERVTIRVQYNLLMIISKQEDKKAANAIQG